MAHAATAHRPIDAGPLPADLERWRFTVEQFYRMGEVGILDEDDWVELIDGQVISLVRVGLRHVSIVIRLNHLLVMKAADHFTVSVNNPLVINEYVEFLPDVTLIKGVDSLERHPLPADIYLAIEVSEQSLAYDQDVKLPRYARGRVAEVWIIDVEQATVERYSEPKSDGTYAKHARFGRDDKIQSTTLPDLQLSVRDVLA